MSEGSLHPSSCDRTRRMSFFDCCLRIYGAMREGMRKPSLHALNVAHFSRDRDDCSRGEEYQRELVGRKQSPILALSLPPPSIPTSPSDTTSERCLIPKIFLHLPVFKLETEGKLSHRVSLSKLRYSEADKIQDTDRSCPASCFWEFI